MLGQAQVLNDLGLVQQETGDHAAAAASHQQALTLFADLGNRLGQAEALNRLGELATRTANTPLARKNHTQALAIARDLSAAPRKHAPWKDSDNAICRMATPAKPTRTCSRHSRSTSASAPPARCAFSKRSSTTGGRPPPHSLSQRPSPAKGITQIAGRPPDP
jgi:hypothetical protein